MKAFIDLVKANPGTFATGSAIANIKSSPQYREKFDTIQVTRFAALIALKGAIYGVFYPLSICAIGLSLASERDFKRHFIPFSSFGKHF